MYIYINCAVISVINRFNINFGKQFFKAFPLTIRKYLDYQFVNIFTNEKKFIKICRGIWNISFISFAIKAIHVILVHAMVLCLLPGSVSVPPFAAL